MGFDSLFTGISGLDAYQSQIDMISNDIANVGTVGFKGQDMTFADMFYQTQGFASGPSQSRGGVDPQEIGLGVQVNSISTNFAQGGLQTTGVNTDLAVNGDGFFILRNTDASGQPIYTRDGHFQLNSNGLLYDPATGLAVQGYTANAQGQVNAGSALGNLTIPIGLVSQASGTGFGAKVGPNADKVFDVQMGGNLDQSQWQTEEQGIINGVGAGQGQTDTISTTIYDSLGNPHQAFIKYVPDATGATAATVANAGAADTGAVTVAPGTPNNDTITITANAAGTQATITDTNGFNQTFNAGQQVTVGGASFTLANPLPANGVETITVGAAKTGLPSTVNNPSGSAVAPATRWKVEVYFADGTMVNGQSATSNAPATMGYAYYDQNGQFINTSSSVGVPGAALTTNLHQAGQAAAVAAGDLLDVTTWGQVNGNQPATGPIGLDFSTTTSLANSSTSGTGYSATVVSQNGYPAGTLSNITIGQDGSITGAFTNGQNKTLGQVALATFQNEDGLNRVGGNGFQATANSGVAQIGTGTVGRFGAIVAGSLEESNVSLADEFTKMIVAQRAFEANTRGISTGDQNMQTVLAIRASEN